MAHFAELDQNNKVLQVVVVSNEDVDANGGDESAEAETFVATIVPFLPFGGAWKQTSYSGSFRKQYAGVGYFYNPSLDMFICPQPFPSWSLDSSGDWKAPVTYPDDVSENSLIVFPTWDEDNQRWLGSTWSDDTEGDGTETQYTWDASSKEWNAV
jgi:hypothetical protein|tara:strand:- start:186 stop:650 length:465 start_codon:yes stop_codon:yes gene_type:complete